MPGITPQAHRYTAAVTSSLRSSGAKLRGTPWRGSSRERVITPRHEVATSSGPHGMRRKMAPRRFSSPVIGLIRCRATPDCQGDIFLSFKLDGINRLGIQIKGRARLRVAQKLLNRLYILAPANQEGRKAVTNIVEAKPLTRLQPDSGFDGGGAISATTIAGEKAAKSVARLVFLSLGSGGQKGVRRESRKRMNPLTQNSTFSWFVGYTF
jgi:hypothetical protein